MSELGEIRVSDGARIAYRFDGPEQAPMLVLAHSLGADSAMWDPQVEAWRGEFRLLRYDSRGHGRSDAPAGAYGMDRLGRDALELIEALTPGRVAFCGVSMGGMVGQWLGARASGRLDALVLANTAAAIGPPSGWQARIDEVRTSGMGRVAEIVVARWFTPGFAAERPDAVAQAEAGIAATSPVGYEGCCCAIRDADQAPSAPAVAAPTLVIAGTHDPVVPPAASRSLCERIPGARYLELDGSHLCSLEQVEAFNSAVGDFLRAAGGDRSQSQRG